MASDGEDDYCSDKFLLESVPLTSKKELTYAERRRQNQRKSEIKNVENRKKSRRQLEEEAREEGLKLSLFERAQEEERELGHRNKAIGMMLKMGFKPGESLGRSEGESNTVAGVPGVGSAPVTTGASTTTTTTPAQAEADLKETSTSLAKERHRAVPLSLDVWSGKKGVGLGKRAPSPGSSERVAKAARIEEEGSRDSYRSRTRGDYEERRATGRLLSATRTLLTLDEKAGVEFNILSLDPSDATTFPPEVLDVLSETASKQMPRPVDRDGENERLRQQMQFDALQPMNIFDLADETNEGLQKPSPSMKTDLTTLSEEKIEEAISFLRLNAPCRLALVLQYLREHYNYCFWCGTQYDSREDLDSNCPGDDEDAHD